MTKDYRFSSAKGCRIFVATYGTIVEIEANTDELLEKAKSIAHKAFFGRVTITDRSGGPVDERFTIELASDGVFRLFRGSNAVCEAESREESIFFNFFTSFLRVTLAENAKPWVFVHAGAVGIAGRAVIFPAMSHSGKTTLVAELVRRGAEYFSDEYAVFDADGLLHPFPRNLAIRRGGRGNVIEVPPSELGGVVASRPMPVGAVVFTDFKIDASWQPETLSLGRGITEILPHTIPIRVRTKFSMKVLNNGLSRAIILKGPREDARAFVESLLFFLNNDLHWSEQTLN